MTFWPGRSVFLTGHAGFKGGWLALYLSALGARVHGFGRSRTAGPSFYGLAKVRERLASETIGDVRDIVALRSAIDRTRPDVVIHLAARVVVREALADPVGTLQSNIIGSANVMDAVRTAEPPPALVIATSDKVYRNVGSTRAFREDDPLGGLDPYGASKACVEFIADSYRHTFGLTVATARCANVIGGGDWGAHRLVPNCIEAFGAERSVTVYDAARVFLHVLDAARGYAMLAEEMVRGRSQPTAYNFGPLEATHVEAAALLVARAWGDGHVTLADTPPDRESRHLDIDSTRALTTLGWRPEWSLKEAVGRTVAWHRAHLAGADMELVSMEQLSQYRALVERERAA